MEVKLLIFVVLSFVGYISFIVNRYGVLPSISESYYKMKDDKLFGGSLFTLFIWSLSLPLIIIGDTPLMFFAGAFLSFVGAASAFKDLKMTKRVHTIGAVGGIGFGFLSMVLDFQLNEITFFMLLGSLILYLLKIKNLIWWVEILAFVLIILGLFIAKV
jgi:hypothetical protein